MGTLNFGEPPFGRKCSAKGTGILATSSTQVDKNVSLYVLRVRCLDISGSLNEEVGVGCAVVAAIGFRVSMQDASPIAC